MGQTNPDRMAEQTQILTYVFATTISLFCFIMLVKASWCGIAKSTRPVYGLLFTLFLANTTSIIDTYYLQKVGKDTDFLRVLVPASELISAVSINSAQWLFAFQAWKLSKELLTLINDKEARE